MENNLTLYIWQTPSNFQKSLGATLKGKKMNLNLVISNIFLFYK